MTRLSIIIPVLNEADGVAVHLAALQDARGRGVDIVVVDGGSRDATVSLALPLADLIVTAPRGRAAQMNAGARATDADILLFLHADTRLPPDFEPLVLDGLATTGRMWGRFDVAIAGAHPFLPKIAALMNIRSRLTGIATGDQAMFMTRAAFDHIGGFPDLPLMEDIEASRRLKHLSPPVCLRARVSSSGRRWERHGVLRTIYKMWSLRLRWFFGADAQRLARDYGYVPRD
jgi:rSAM/selenodomain-associated transferase 2